MNILLKQAMEKRGLDYKALAEKGGWSYSSVRFWVLGERIPSIENARRLEEILKFAGLAKHVRTP